MNEPDDVLRVARCDNACFHEVTNEETLLGFVAVVASSNMACESTGDVEVEVILELHQADGMVFLQGASP